MNKKSFYLKIFFIASAISLHLSGCSDNSGSDKYSIDDTEAINILENESLPDSIVVSPKSFSESSPSDEEAKALEEVEELRDSQAYTQVIDLCEKYAEEFSNGPLVDDFYLFSGYAYDCLELHNKSINTLSKILQDFPDSSSMSSACYRIATIYHDELNQPDISYLYYAKCIETAGTDIVSLNGIHSSMDALSEVNISFDVSNVSYDAENNLQNDIAGIQKNTNESLNAILDLAKKHSSVLLVSDRNKAIKYIYDNFPNYYDSDEKMELIIYYGSLLDEAYSDVLEESQIGFKALQSVKYVYRKAESALSDSTQICLENLNELLDKYLKYHSLESFF